MAMEDNSNARKAKALTWAVNTCRFIVALAFMFSGYVKAVDPLGTQYKIEDYAQALGAAELLPGFVALTMSVLLSGIEFSLGVMLLFAIRRHLASRTALAFMAFMTLLTLWLAIANPVEDCGCFGDAVKLTNWETFGKNILLLAATTVLCISPSSMKRFINKKWQWIAINATVLFITSTSVWCIYDLPVIDFRPYKTGTDIRKSMEIPEGAKPPRFETTFILEKDGVRKEFTLDDYPDSTWTFIDSKTVQTAAGYTAPIHDFFIKNQEGEDVTDEILDEDTYTFLLISPHIEDADDSNFGEIGRIYEYANDKGYKFYGVTASGERAIKRWSEMTGAEYEFLTMDDITLKTMIRSNPGLMLLKKGKIINKWSNNRLPENEKLDKQTK